MPLAKAGKQNRPKPIKKSKIMNTPNPLIPQGTFPDHRGHSRIRITVFIILAAHGVLLSGLLMLGFRRQDQETADKGQTNTYPPLILPADTNPPSTAQITSTPPVITPNPIPTPPVTPGAANEVTGSSTGAEHVVMKGDSFYSLSKKYGVTMKAIGDANPGVDSSK